MSTAHEIYNSLEPTRHPAELARNPEEKRDIIEAFYKGCTPDQAILQTGTKNPAFAPLLSLPPLAPEPNVHPLGGISSIMESDGKEVTIQSFVNHQGIYFPAGFDQTGYDRFGPRQALPNKIHAHSEPPSTLQCRIELMPIDEGFDEVTETFFDKGCPELKQCF